MSQDARNTVKNSRVIATCRICAACYEPSNAVLTLGNHPYLLCESALLSISHFCFRCRRPSCPDCWNKEYSLCASCTQATHLHVSGAMYRGSEAGTNTGGSLVCVKFGRYHLAPRSQEIAHISSDSASTSISRHNVAQLQKRATQHPKHSSVAVAHDSKAQASIMTAMAQKEIALDEFTTIPDPGQRRRKVSFVGLGFVIVLIILLIGALMAASLSTEVNTYLSQTLHIDVRGYLFMLWDWLQQLHV